VSHDEPGPLDDKIIEMTRALLSLLLATLLACNLPRDSSGTLHRVEHGVLRVGVIHDPPWAAAKDALAGVEVQLVSRLARDLGARAAWTPGAESELLAALHDRDLDLVIGGLTADSPWKKKVAFTRQYYTDSIIVSAPAGIQPDRIHGTPVAVEAGTPVIRYLRKKGAVPLATNDLTGARGAVAAPAWLLARLGRPQAGLLVYQAQHVLAVPPGENQWLMRVERFLQEERDSVPQLLRAGR
jgi:polar amino acid transport system substrate-binding protein